MSDDATPQDVAAQDDDSSTPDMTESTKAAATEARRFGGGRFAGGMPAEKSKNFGGTARRLLRSMDPERTGALVMVFAAIASVVLAVIGPRLLGDATDVIVRGFFSDKGVDFAELGRILGWVIALFAGASLLSWVQSYALAGVVQRTMERLRRDVEDKINRLSLSYVDSQPRGDLLSRVTNDIDNVATSMQQSLSQVLTSVLTVIGVVIMMYTISVLLATIALFTIPISLGLVKFIGTRSKGHFISQWVHTGALNAQVEEAFTGHSLVKVFGQQAVAEKQFEDKNQELYEAGFRAQFIAGTIQPVMMFLGNLNFVAIAVIGGLAVKSGSMTIGDIQAFIQYSRRFTQPMTQLASMPSLPRSSRIRPVASSSTTCPSPTSRQNR